MAEPIRRAVATFPGGSCQGLGDGDYLQNASRLGLLLPRMELRDLCGDQMCRVHDHFTSRPSSDTMRFSSVFLSAILALTGVLRAGSAAEEAQFISNARQLIYEGKRSGEGYFSSDGKMLIFQSERDEGNPFYQIYLLDLETGDIRRVSSGVGKTTCGFLRPDGKEAIFASTHLDPQATERQRRELELRASGKQRRYSWDYDASMDIFATESDGGPLRRLTDAPGYDAEGSFSPDGRHIVFTSLRGAFQLEQLSAEDRKRFETDPAYFGEIYVMNADGSDQRRLTHAPGYDGGPFFSPDGQRIIWRRFDGMNADIYTMKTNGSDTRRVTDFQSISWAPFYHPSGEYVIFTSNKLGFSNFELFIVDTEGTREPVRVTFTDGFDGLPVFSPDGRKLSWASGRSEDGRPQIFLADWNHEAAQGELARAPLRQAANR
jgi:Tol biopolymer transport system component